MTENKHSRYSLTNFAAIAGIVGTLIAIIALLISINSGSNAQTMSEENAHRDDLLAFEEMISLLNKSENLDPDRIGSAFEVAKRIAKRTKDPKHVRQLMGLCLRDFKQSVDLTTLAQELGEPTDLSASRGMRLLQFVHEMGVFLVDEDILETRDDTNHVLPTATRIYLVCDKDRVDQLKPLLNDQMLPNAVWRFVTSSNVNMNILPGSAPREIVRAVRDGTLRDKELVFIEIKTIDGTDLLGYIHADIYRDLIKSMTGVDTCWVFSPNNLPGVVTDCY